ncbi:hypothetical protein HY339_02885 [Candidatus Gottesmanbacteria bacterium]|nr:hypothetical protein [Candidatus Gottesmanbacteria bacterium]
MEDKLVVILRHENVERHPNQRIMVINISDYAYLVPYVEDTEKIFLKTIYPSRKHTKVYIEKGGT